MESATNELAIAVSTGVHFLSVTMLSLKSVIIKGSLYMGSPNGEQTLYALKGNLTLGGKASQVHTHKNPQNP